MMLPGGAGAITGSGARDVTTAAVLVCELVVVTAGVRAAYTVVEAGCVRDAVDAAGAVASAGEPTIADLRSVDVERVELGLLPMVFDLVTCSGVDDLVDGSSAVALLAEVLGLAVAVVGSVLVVSITVVLAPPEACTTPSCGSVDDPDGVEESAVASGDDADDVDATVESWAEAVDGEPVDVELLDEVFDVSVDDGSLGSASAIAGLLAIAMPTPSATANAPTRPI
jgi:hypothetical protein